MNQGVIALLAALACPLVLHGCFLAPAAAVGGVALVAEDRRSAGTMVEDQNIEIKINRAIETAYSKDDRVTVSATSFNRYVLLTGEVPTEAIKKDVGVLALGVENVRNVQNEVTVSAPESFAQRSADTLTTSKVKSRFATEGKVQANYVKVVTRNNVVYLMGLVKPQEADAATEVARSTGGVEKVVRVFEISDTP